MKRKLDHALELKKLQDEIIASNACPRLVRYCRKVAEEKRAMYREETYWGKALPSFGDPAAELVIVGLAPAAHGGNRTGRMFTGDRSGDFLFQGLYDAGFANQPIGRRKDDGLVLQNCYITTIVRWAPPLNKPTPLEVRRCLPFLAREMELLNRVRAVLVLGKFAYDGYLRVARAGSKLPPKNSIPFGHGAAYDLPHPLPRLYCSYHPSQHNTQTGRLTPEMFRSVLSNIQDWLSKTKPAP